VRVGDIVIEPVLDGVARMEASAAYRGMGTDVLGANEEDWSPHLDLLDADGMLEMAFGGFLLRVGERVILVDTGLGDVEQGPLQGGRFLIELAALGVRPEQVTDVLLTHLHFDHVGWSTHHGEVVFQNATYRCDLRDWEHFVGPEPGATEKLLPLTGQLEPWDASGPLLPGIDTMSAPGHTPGSTILIVSSGTDRAMLLGDVVHCPVQLIEDEWGGLGDVDPELARRTRVALARELEGSDIPVAAAHFPGMQFGRLLTGSGKRSWILSGLHGNHT
jgi:glyoxylase-like metal-dependent hydrolase (beta-lactamase superfamily II)